MKFTILCATQKCGKYIGEAVNSVLNQTYKDWEMLILDDCSSDDTYQKALEAAQGHCNIKVMKNDARMYCSNTYQKLLEIANGEICGVLDGDDVLAPNAIERIVGLYDKHQNVSWIYTQSFWCNDNLVPRRKGLSRLPLKGQLLYMGMRQMHCFSHWRTFKTRLREKRKPLFEKDLKCAVDKSLGYVLEELGAGGFLDECLYYYRYHRENMSHKTPQRPVWKQVVQRAVQRRAKLGIKAKGVTTIK